MNDRRAVRDCAVYRVTGEGHDILAGCQIGGTDGREEHLDILAWIDIEQNWLGETDDVEILKGRYLELGEKGEG